MFNRNMEKVLREEFVIRDFTRDFLFIQPGHIAVAAYGRQGWRASARSCSQGNPASSVASATDAP